MAEMKAKPTEPVMVFQWHITDQCDQRCTHCYIFGENPCKTLYSAPFDRMKEVVDRCMAYTARRHFRLQFAISGGDPLLNPDFWQLAEYLKQNDIPYAIMGNPFHLTQAVCDRLYTLGCTDYQVSIDGLRDTHDRMRRPGSFDATWACLPLLHKAGITSHVMSTVSHLNLWEIPDLIDLAVQHGVGVYGFARYVPTGPDKKNAIRPTEYRAFLDACYQKYRKYRAEGCLTQFAEKEHLFVLYKYEEGLVRIPKDAKPGVLYDGCHIGLPGAILPDGTLLACRRTAGSEIGSVFDDDFPDEEGLCQKRRLAYRALDKYEDCSKCRLSQWCRGCHAVARGQSGDFFARDPQCWHIVEADEAAKA